MRKSFNICFNEMAITFNYAALNLPKIQIESKYLRRSTSKDINHMISTLCLSSTYINPVLPVSQM
jgi:hypothetical protein